MYDPTKSRYRYLALEGVGAYRRFIKADDNIESVGVVYRDSNSPTHGTYGALLFDPRWRARRLEILSRDKQQCVICAGSNSLQVHHRQYHFLVNQNQFKMPWDYPDRLLITLCEPCHKSGHGKYKVPTINI
jgi:5-methylcytosine-specific restriction endonuclease McrA